MRFVPAWRRVAIAAVVWIGLGCASSPDPVAPTAPIPAPAPPEPAVVEESAPASEDPAPTPSEPADTATASEAPPSPSVDPSPRPAPPAPVAPEPPAPRAAPAIEREPRVALVQFTTGVEEREPMDAVTFLGNDAHEILFYTDLRDLSGATVVHRWEYQGEVVSEVPFDVRGDRWRVWSRKALAPEQVGDWTVSVVAPDGEVLAVETFSYQDVR